MAARVIRADNARSGVIPAAVADAQGRARAIVHAAEERAEALREAAERRGRERAQAELAAELTRMAEAREHELSSMRETAIAIGLQAAARLLGGELAQRPEQVGELVVPLLRRVRRARAVTLRVHPDDVAALEHALSALRDRAELSGTLRVEADAALTRGGCVVHSNIGSLDARVETQLAALEHALKQGR